MQVEVKRAQAGDIPVIEAILRDVAVAGPRRAASVECGGCLLEIPEPGLSNRGILYCV